MFANSKRDVVKTRYLAGISFGDNRRGSVSLRVFEARKSRTHSVLGVQGFSSAGFRAEAERGGVAG